VFTRFVLLFLLFLLLLLLCSSSNGPLMHVILLTTTEPPFYYGGYGEKRTYPVHIVGLVHICTSQILAFNSQSKGHQRFFVLTLPQPPHLVRDGTRKESKHQLEKQQQRPQATEKARQAKKPTSPARGSPACSTPSSPASGTTRRGSTGRHRRTSRRWRCPPHGPAPPGRYRRGHGQAGAGPYGSWTSTARWSWRPRRSGAGEFPWWWRRCFSGRPTAVTSARWHVFFNAAVPACRCPRWSLSPPGPTVAAACSHPALRMLRHGSAATSMP
jgi:hypothetical protein